MKPIYKSKMVWFNVIMLIVLSIPVILAAVKSIEPGWAVLADAVGSLIVGIGNIILRIYFTDEPLNTPKARKKNKTRYPYISTSSSAQNNTVGNLSQALGEAIDREERKPL